MARPKKKLPVLIIDTREKIPWDFEGDERFEDIIYQKLDVGDYSIQGLEHLICIERKMGADELFNNFGSKNKARLYREMERMKNHKVKVIIVEQSCADLMNPDSYYINKKGINKQSPRMPTAVVMSSLTDIMVRYGIGVIFGEHKAQSMARGLLLRAYDLHLKGELD